MIHFVVSLQAKGNTLASGFFARFQTEMAAMADCVCSAPDTKHAVFVGGSILSSLSLFERMVMSKQDYDEHGASFINRICANV
jgi:actin-related protein